MQWKQTNCHRIVDFQIFKTELRSYVCQVLFTKAHGFAGAALR